MSERSDSRDHSANNKRTIPPKQSNEVLSQIEQRAKERKEKAAEIKKKYCYIAMKHCFNASKGVSKRRSRKSSRS